MRPVRLDTRGLVGLAEGPDEGRPLVMLHGFPDLPRGYVPLMERFAARGRRTVAPYLRGYAPSTTRGVTSLDVLTEDLLAWADHLSPTEPIDAIGHDWGSVIVQRACLLRPERFRRVVLMSVPHVLAFVEGVRREPAQLWRSRYMAHFQAGKLADVLVRADRYRYVRDLWARWSPSLRPDEDYLAELFACFDASWPAPLAFYRVAKKRGRWPVSMLGEPDLARDSIGVPTLYLHGEEDGCVGPGLAEGQERYFTGEFTAKVLSGVGHFLHVEDPARVFDEAAPFLERG
ncbi:MAG: alpha/beta hydrolase [Myxococcales bacterium]|nr:alpha/beta hydrolase [Myxococcales bacterium]